MPNANDLRNVLGLNDLGGAVKPKEPTGAGALRNDLEQAGAPSVTSVGRQTNWAPTSGGQSYSVPWSTSPIQMPEYGEEIQSPPMRINLPTSVAAPQVSSTPPSSVSGSSGSGMMTNPISNDELVDSLLPSYGSTDKLNDEYDEYWSMVGQGEPEREVVRPDGSPWMNALKFVNPGVGMAVDNLVRNPIANQLAESSGLKNAFGKIGDFLGTDTVDDARSAEDATAPWATGEAMQHYGEMGMGGRNWWEYDPYRLYNKADEQQDFGFVPYLPDDRSRLGMAVSQILDAPSDIAGALSKGREILPDVLSATNPLLGMAVKNIYGGNNGHYTMNVGGKKVDGLEWESFATPYVNNMRRILDHDPEKVLRMPKDGKLHGAPVSTLVMEYAIPNADGGVSYLHGEYANSRYNDDGSLHINFTDGQGVDIPESVYSEWMVPGDQPDTWDVNIPFEDMTSYVRLEDARGFLPRNLDTLNERAIKEKDYASAPVLYMPDMELDDGTRLTWEEVQQAYVDEADGSNPAISYDFGPLGLSRPQRLSQDLFDGSNVNLASIPNSAIDNTLGSLPIMFDTLAWPYAISQAAGKSAYGIDPGKYDPYTGSDQYISADVDENGHLVPTYTAAQQATNIVGNAIVPALENLAGPLSGHSFVERLLGEPMDPNTFQLWRNFLMNVAGEGAEEIIGNFSDEITNQADAAYGDLVTPEGERLLDDQGNPVRDRNGDYKYTYEDGTPRTSWVDESGHVYRDPNTPWDRRLSNALNLSREDVRNDWLNAFAGGMEVAGLLDAPRVIGSTPRTIRNDIMERRMGMRPYVETPMDRYMADPENNEMPERVEISPEFLRLFDNELPEEAY